MNRSIENILEKGITQYGTRNDILLVLIRYHASCGRNPEETFAAIKTWLETKSHRSKTWERNPESVLADLEYKINRWYTNRRPKVAEILVPLAQPDLEVIIRNTHLLKENGRYGARAFRMQQFQFHLIAFYKALKRDTVYLPINGVKQMNGASRHTASGHLKYCERIGLITMVSSYDRFAHKSRRYRLNYQPQEGIPIRSLEEGLCNRYGVSELYRRYSRRIYVRIRGFSNTVQSDQNI